MYYGSSVLLHGTLDRRGGKLRFRDQPEPTACQRDLQPSASIPHSSRRHFSVCQAQIALRVTMCDIAVMGTTAFQVGSNSIATTCLKLCSTYERLISSSLSPSSLRLSSLRTTARSSLRHKSLVRIYAVHRALCRSSLKKVCADPNPECSIYS